jgi:D-alanyl-lipoteichoic acid acyltransferase DltB (MBOAT superfamily)
MTINILILFVFILIALVGYLHYLVNKQMKEIDQIWSQIAILVLSTASKISELKIEQDKIKNDENRK